MATFYTPLSPYRDPTYVPEIDIYSTKYVGTLINMGTRGRQRIGRINPVHVLMGIKAEIINSLRDVTHFSNCVGVSIQVHWRTDGTRTWILLWDGMI